MISILTLFDFEALCNFLIIVIMWVQLLIVCLVLGDNCKDECSNDWVENI